MPKTVSLNEMTYAEIVSLAGRLTMMAKKPVSIGLTIHVASYVLKLELDRFNQKQKEDFRKALKMFTEGDFDKTMEELFRIIAVGK